ncbi:hypothetical protein [Micromonospora zhanjiangensis]|uniref:Pyrrolo-quinoline quinone repeat domain-containing protein n=1 Tax=Micromonospora zhanjiangensis TaxID=1522057 RepID=A0ABV8KEE3_9ACTN
MAKGSGPCVKCWLALALVGVIILVATGVWNPFPDLWQWASQNRALSEPAPAWQQRLGGSPTSVTIAGNTAVVEERTSVEARSLATGVKLWDRKADWAAVAGADRDAVVAVGKLLEKGYQVLDPETGAVRRSDKDAVAVWTYRNALLDVRCVNAKDCTLTAWDPRGSTPAWSAFLPGVHAGLLADNPKLLGTRRLTARRVADDASGPELMPGLLGLPVDGRVVIVDTAAGRVMQDVQPGREDRVVVVGGRMLRIEARARDASCYFTVIARDPATGQEVWRRTSLNLRTADGAGCVQRDDPQGGQNVVVAVGPDGREVVLDAYDGRYLWVGAAGEKLLAVDDRYALARSADGGSVNVHELPVEATRWSRPLAKEGPAALTRYAVVLIDEKPDRIIATEPRGGRELVNIRSDAKVFAVGPGGMIIGDGRDLGYVRFSGSGSDRPGPGAGRPDAGPGDGKAGTTGPTCDGPKNEVCPPRGG